MIHTRKKKAVDLTAKSKRTIELKIRVNKYEYEKILKRVTEKTISGWLRNIALKTTPIHPADPNLLRSLGRIGSNLNQLTKYVNTNRVLDKAVLNEITAIRKILNELIENNLAASRDDKRDDL